MRYEEQDIDKEGEKGEEECWNEEN